MQNTNWKLLAVIPPLLVWIGLFLYTLSVEAKLRKVKRSLDALASSTASKIP